MQDLPNPPSPSAPGPPIQRWLCTGLISLGLFLPFPTFATGFLAAACLLALACLQPRAGSTLVLLAAAWFMALPDRMQHAGLLSLLLFAAVFLLARPVPSRTRICWLVFWSVGAAAQSGITWWRGASLATDPELPERFRLILLEGRARGPFLLPSHLAWFCGAVLLVLLFGKPGAFPAWIRALGGLTAAGALLATRSISGVIWLGAALVFHIMRTSFTPSARVPRWVYLAGAALLVTGGVWLRSGGHGHSLSASLREHAADTRIGLELAAASDPFGAGPGGIAGRLLDRASDSYHETRQLHDAYLQAIPEAGWILGAALLIGAAMAARRKRTGASTLGGTLWFHFLAYNLGDFLVLSPGPMLLAAWCLAPHDPEADNIRVAPSAALLRLALAGPVFALCLWFALQTEWDARNPTWERMDRAEVAPGWLLAGTAHGWPLLPNVGANLARRWPFDGAAASAGIQAELALRLSAHPDPGVRRAMAKRMSEAGLPDAAAVQADTSP